MGIRLGDVGQPFVVAVDATSRGPERVLLHLEGPCIGDELIELRACPF